MSDSDQQPPVGGEVPTNEPDDKKPAPGADPEGQPEGSGESFWQKEVKSARQEAAKYRTKAKDLEKKIEAEQRAKLEADGNWQKLYEQAKSDLSVREQEVEQSGMYKSAFMSVLQRRIDTIPEANRTLVPTDYEPIKLSEWLDANWQRLASPKFPNLDPGAGSASTGTSGGGGAALSPMAQEVARRLKIPEDRAKQVFKDK